MCRSFFDRYLSTIYLADDITILSLSSNCLQYVLIIWVNKAIDDRFSLTVNVKKRQGCIGDA